MINYVIFKCAFKLESFLINLNINFITLTLSTDILQSNWKASTVNHVLCMLYELVAKWCTADCSSQFLGEASIHYQALGNCENIGAPIQDIVWQLGAKEYHNVTISVAAYSSAPEKFFPKGSLATLLQGSRGAQWNFYSSALICSREMLEFHAAREIFRQ